MGCIPALSVAAQHIGMSEAVLVIMGQFLAAILSAVVVVPLIYSFKCITVNQVCHSHIFLYDCCIFTSLTLSLSLSLYPSSLPTFPLLSSPLSPSLRLSFSYLTLSCLSLFLSLSRYYPSLPLLHLTILHTVSGTF